ncbi:SEC12-like protein 1 [Morella rubra]|uniref:SEC12-like protein 1 n=1 Tax=Morella rubra TaxID=262757 RepID=A0A6A1WJ35_9ROSI|nr:SEC12-like protein 1 [Morella rubra]
MAVGGGSRQGPVTCGAWIRRPDKANLVVLGRSRLGDLAPSVLEIFSFNPKTTSLSPSPLTTYTLEQGDGDLISIAVHPTGDDIICSTANSGCKLFEFYGGRSNASLLAKELPPLEGVGPQKCLAFSFDGSKVATGGVDGHLRILEWPSLRIILDEPKAHKSVRDMDFSLDSEFLASTSTDGSARIWKAEDGAPVTTLTRNSDEQIELCTFSKDGTKPFLFTTLEKGDKFLAAVWDISTWKRIGYKKLLKKPASVMSTSLDGKYLAMGSKDGDISVVEVKKMEIVHYSRRLHVGASIPVLEFCPSERVVLTTTVEWGAAVATKLDVPRNGKNDAFWKLPQRYQPGGPQIFGNSQSFDDQNDWDPEL